MRGTCGIIGQLDKSSFQPVVLCSESVLDRCRRSIRRADVEWIGIPDHLPSAIKRIAAAKCDILCHWQIGTDPLNYFLPFAKLAPVQCTGWGTHGTTGISEVDYYVSSRLIETEGAEEHYIERLYRLETLPTYQPFIPPPGPADRSDFGFPERGNLYCCPQRLPKFHPDFDPILRAILEADPRGYLILLEGSSVHAAAQLRKRFERTLGATVRRLIFLPAQEPAAYCRMLSLVDVVLDPPHYSSGWTGYDAFSLALPVVTLPGQFSVERLAMALHRKMGIAELVADSPEDYVTRAIRLGTDRDCRHAVRSHIAERNDVLFDDVEVVREHERFFEQALERARESCP
ncbi:MAG: hypothetical protein ACC655_06560 [Rhodothermia bacterium]